MTQEIVRELVDGVWVTRPKDQSGGPGGGITEITSTDMSVTITDPSGPTADLSVSGGSSAVASAVVRLSAADILGLPGTPIEIVPEQAGKILVPLQLVSTISAGDPYSGQGASMTIAWDGAPGYGLQLDQLSAALAAGPAAAFDIAILAFAGSPPGDAGFYDALSTFADLPLMLTSSSMAITGGTSTAVLNLLYQIASVA